MRSLKTPAKFISVLLSFIGEKCRCEEVSKKRFFKYFRFFKFTVMPQKLAVFMNVCVCVEENRCLKTTTLMFSSIWAFLSIFLIFGFWISAALKAIVLCFMISIYITLLVVAHTYSALVSKSVRYKILDLLVYKT